MEQDHYSLPGAGSEDRASQPDSIPATTAEHDHPPVIAPYRAAELQSRRLWLWSAGFVGAILVAAVLGLPAFDTPALRRYVMTAKSRILDYSYNARVAPEHMRTASHIEHRGQCSVPGCDVPHDWLQIDHIDPVDNGGETQLANVEPKCGPDNQAKGAATGHTAWKDRPPPPRYQPKRRQDRSSGGDEEDADADISDSRFSNVQ